MTHIPVLLKECIDGLNIKPDGIYIDGTLGRGGHTLEIAKRLTTGKVIAIDRDEDAIEEAKAILAGYEDLIQYEHTNYNAIPSILQAKGINETDGMIFDFGVSSPQLDNYERGFSYMHDAPLDMRMDRRDDLTAFDLVNSGSENELRDILREYGEEKYAKLIARAIVTVRATRQIKTTFELNDIIIKAIPAAGRRESQHPAKRCYQALRMAINNETDSISEMLVNMPGILKKDGRVCIISFHSIEDRLVKNAFIKYANGCTCPKDFPICVCGFVPVLKIITKKPITPSEAEVEQNPRSRSAKLRIAERI